MNRVVSHALAQLWLLVGLLTALPGGVVSAQPRNSSQVRYTTTSHNFGKIQETDGPVSFTFEFTNTSRSPFVIEFISVSCGCTTPEYSKEPVLPGKSGRITVTYDPTGRPGVFNTPVIVTSNNRRDQVQLSLIGEVIPRPKTIADEFPIILSDNGLRSTSNTLLFGYMGRGSQKAQSMDLYNNGTSPMTLSYQFTNQVPEGVCKITINPVTLQPQQRGQLTFTYDLSKADVWGLQAVGFVLTINGQPTNKSISAYATATDNFAGMTPAQKENAPKATFNSQFYHFGTVQRNATLTREFEMTNTGKSPLIIRHSRANSPRISYSIPRTTIAPGETIVISVTLKSGNKAERMSESLSIVMNDPARPMREIRLGANVE